MRPRVHFVSLGCPKNRVDSERMAFRVQQAGMQVVADPADAEAIVVHTCGFIRDAAQESVDTILDMAQFKTQGRCRTLLVSGCLSQRFGAELGAGLPEIDVLLGTGSALDVATRLREHFAQLRTEQRPAQRVDVRDPNSMDLDVGLRQQAGAACTLDRLLDDHGGSAYLKISEGCDRHCAFCLIPGLRGRQRSRPIADLVAEAQALVAAGVVEINLIAQDLSAYGSDLQPRADLPSLLKALDQVEGLRWLRCLYAYPQGVTKPLRQVLAQGQRLLPYLDLPLQHASTTVLRRMRRGSGGLALRGRLHRLRDEVPGLIMRTTFLTGFPGESEADFAELQSLVKDFGFDRIGVFAYADEEGSASYKMRDKVPETTANKRRRGLMQAQRRISKKRLKALRGTIHEAIVEGLHPESDLLVVGRLWSQAPEVDGMTYLSSPHPLKRGQIVKVRVVDSHDYDLVAEVLEPGDSSPAAPFSARATADAASAR